MRKFYLGLFIAFMGSAFGQNIYFTFTDGTSQAYPIAEVRKMDFSTSQLNLHRTDGSVLSWNFENIDHYAYQQPTGFTMIEDVAKLNLFPNPVEGMLKLQYHLPQQKSAELQIYTINGQLLMQQQVEMTGAQHLELDLSKYPAGQYICRLAGSKLVLSKTFIKQ